MKKEEVSVLERIRRLIEPDEKREQTAKGQGPEAETNEEAEAGPEADTEDTGSARVAEPRLEEAGPEAESEGEVEAEPEFEIDSEIVKEKRIEELEAQVEYLYESLNKKEEEVKTARNEGYIEGRNQGLIAGRNARIEEFLVTDPDDSIPSPGASAPQSSAADSIFSLAAGAR